MNYNFITFVLILLPFAPFAQDTTYFNIYGTQTANKDSASYFEVTKPNLLLNSNNYTKTKYFLNGRIMSETSYFKNQLNGKQITYFEDGGMQYEINYKFNKVDGLLVTYYPNQKLKRKETYINDSILNSTCYTISGADTTYFKYLNPPVFEGGSAALSRYINSKINYPTEAIRNNIEGIVYVAFFINKFGEVTYPTIYKSNWLQLNNEALRIIKSLPNWTIGTIDNEPSAFKFIIPVKFVLLD